MGKMHRRITVLLFAISLFCFAMAAFSNDAKAEFISKPYEISNVMITFFFFDTEEEMQVYYRDNFAEAEGEEKLIDERLRGFSYVEVYEEHNIPIDTLAQRVRHVVQSSFNGRRIVIFSGGATKSRDELIDEIQGIADGGGFGSIIGRNSFQRPRSEAIDLLHEVMGIYARS